jgi:peptidoglycan/LPS O-acetylase OafA/YrhL
MAKSIYFKQLNGIRFIAVLLVLIDHWLIPINPFYFFGHLGVVIFFVLSGFLITRILFESADQCRVRGSSINVKLFIFITRRSLRIFPTYFILLILGYFFTSTKYDFLIYYLITYTPNLYIIKYQSWIGIWDHLWTLAVEEQYYLIFPFVIFYNKVSRYKWIILCMVIIGLSNRLYFYILMNHDLRQNFWFVSHVNPLSALDSFGLGGLLAYIFHYKRYFFDKYLLNYKLFLTSILLYIGIVVLVTISKFNHDNIWSIVFERSFAGLFSFFLIAQALSNQTWMMGRFLQLSWVSYLGQISYGIYLYHNVVYNYYHMKGNTIIGYLSNYLPELTSELPNFIYLKFIFSFIIVLGLASVSWFFIEKPINRFKNRI